MRHKKRTGYSAGYVFFTVSAMGALAGLVPPCRAQATNPPPVSVNKAAGLRFEVASVRLAPELALSAMASGKPPHVGTKIVGDRVDMGSVSLMLLISTAYSVRPDLVSGPEWMNSQRFDVLAKFPAGATKEQLPEMLQTLLEERFKLVFHRAGKLESELALVVGPKGHKLQPAIPDDLQSGAKEKAGSSDRRGLGGGSGTFGGSAQQGLNGPQRVSVSDGVSRVEFFGISAKGLAENFGGRLGRPVVDMTGLQGTFHVVLEFSRSDASPSIGNATAPGAPEGDQNPASSAPVSAPFAASVYAAVDKLGLKLESRKVPMERLVIDHIEKLPTEN